jgi:hypothetical protein
MIAEALNERYLAVDQKERAERGWKIGPSNLGDCARKLAFLLNGFEARPLSPEAVRVFELGRQRGDRLEELAKDIWPDARTQVPISIPLFDGVPVSMHAKEEDRLYGTADLWIPSLRTVVDFKTAGAYSAGSLATEGPSREYQLQVHAYRYAIGAAECVAPAIIKAFLVYEVKDTDARRGVKAGQLIEVEVPWSADLDDELQVRLAMVARMHALKRRGALDPKKFEGLPKSHWKCRNGADGQPLYCPVGSFAGGCHS